MSAGGFSKTRFERVHDVLAGYVERGDLPGLVSLVSRRGEIHADAIGDTSVGGDQPMRSDTIFRISSMTKPVTAVATMILVEECKLRLDDPVDELLPELADRQVLQRPDGPLDETVPADRPITTRDLLTFTFGFGLVFGPDPIGAAVVDLMLSTVTPASAPDPDEWIRRLGTLPLVHQPGARWMYGTGSNVLGVLIARASGQSFDAFLRDRIFEPLGMRDTGFRVPASELGRFATAYMYNSQTGALEPFDEPGGQWSAPPAFPSGASGLISTVDDYLAFAQMLLNRGVLRGERILSRPSVETMTTNQLTPAQRALGGLFPGIFDHRGWGFGVSVVTNRMGPSQPVGRYGWEGGFGTAWFNDPHEEMTAILMTQRAGPSPLQPAVCEDFWTSVYQAIDD